MLARLKVWWFSRRLKDVDPRRRQAAVQALARTRHPTALALLHSVSSDPVAAVRLELVQALAPFAAESSLPLGHTLVRDADSSVRQAALTVLARLGRPESLEVVLRLPALPDSQADEEVLRTLDAIHPDWVSLPVTKEVLQSVLNESASARQRIPSWAARLLAGLQDGDFELLTGWFRAAAASADATLWFRLRNAWIRLAAVRPDELTRLLTTDSDPLWRETAALSAGSTLFEEIPILEPGLADALVKALQDQDRFTCHAAAEALGNRRCAAALGPLLEALKKSSDAVYQAVLARTLGQLEQAEACDALLLLLRRASWYPTLLAAAQALAAIRGPSVVEQLRPFAGKSERLRAYCHELHLQLDPDREKKALTSEEHDLRRSYASWQQRIKELDPRRLLADLRTTLKARDEIRTVAHLATAQLDLVDHGTSLDLFLCDFQEHDSWSEAQKIAEQWGLGGFWRRH